jgi:protein-S-isoprenylcysteine O-methyltransferase Ste14
MALLRATDAEFRRRWWIFGAIFGVSFLPAAIDHVPAGARLAAAVASAAHCTPTLGLHVVFGAAALALLAAAALRTWGSAYLGREVVHDQAIHAQVLHADGPYRHVRNPLYLGNIVLAATMGLIAPVSGFVLILAAVPVFCYRLIGREQAALEAQQGEPFRAYMRAVPRLWPSLRARLPPSGGRPDWRSGLAAEAFFWSYALGLALFALTLNVIWVFAGVVASPLCSALAGRAMRKPKA